jgi:hypothetical protein
MDLNLDSLIREVVGIADNITGSLQDTIQYSAWIGYDDFNKPIYDSAIVMSAAIEEKQYDRRLPDGSIITQRATIQITRPIKPNGAVDRREPVDPRDKIVLPNGYTGPILFVDGMGDPDTHAPYAYEIVLG